MIEHLLALRCKATASPVLHRTEESMRRCYACSRPEMFVTSGEDEVLVDRLLREGWRSTSNRYRTVKRVVIQSFDEAVTIHPDAPAWLGPALRDLYEHYATRSWARSMPGESMELTVAQFNLFKRLGGQCA